MGGRSEGVMVVVVRWQEFVIGFLVVIGWERMGRQRMEREVLVLVLVSYYSPWVLCLVSLGTYSLGSNRWKAVCHGESLGEMNRIYVSI